MGDIDLGVCRGQRFRGDPNRVGVLLPGARYLPIAPLLWFTREALTAEGWTVIQVWDEWDRTVEAERWVSERLVAALAAAGEARTLVVAKSITTLAVAAAAERRLPGIWITPLLQTPEIRAGLEAVTAPTLIAGGTADSTWDSGFAAGLEGVEVLEFEGADHILHVPGDLTRSLEILREFTERVRTFVARLA